MVKYMGQKAGGMDKLKGKKIVLLYHDSAYGKEPIPVLTDMSKQYGYELTTIAVPHPGNEQQSQWLQIRQLRPDWVILWGWGVMNPTAIKTAARTGYPREKMIGVWWSGAEEDVVPAGSAAKGYVSAALNAPGADFPVMRDIRKYVYGKGKGEFDDISRFGSIYHTRGVVAGIVTTEAIRLAQAKFGKGKPITGEQMQWGIENLKIDEKRLKELGAVGLLPPLKVSCFDHEGSGLVKFQQWDGTKWKVITDWMEPDRQLVRAKVEADAAQYAKEKGITPRDCPKS
jgi:branched-chain amino acid transport system substrate-binding protein